MRFAVITSQPGCLPDGDRAISVFDNLDDAKEFVHMEIGISYDDEQLPLDAEWYSFHRSVDDMDEKGGKIGILPDGYIIEVTPLVASISHANDFYDGDGLDMPQGADTEFGRFDPFV